MQKIPLTVRGAELLKQELQHLKSVARPEVIEAIAEARSHGDLSENAEYEAAKERQALSRAASPSWNTNSLWRTSSTLPKSMQKAKSYSAQL